MTLWKIGTSTLIQARLPAHHSLKTAAITHNAVRPAPRLTFPRLPKALITRHEVLKSSVRATYIIFCFSKWKLVIDKNDIDNTPHVYLKFLQVNLKLYKDQDVCKLAHKYSNALNGICLGIGMTCSCTYTASVISNLLYLLRVILKCQVWHLCQILTAPQNCSSYYLRNLKYRHVAISTLNWHTCLLYTSPSPRDA